MLQNTTLTCPPGHGVNFLTMPSTDSELVQSNLKDNIQLENTKQDLTDRVLEKRKTNITWPPLLHYCRFTFL